MRFAIRLLQLLRFLPLPLLRALGAGFGYALYALMAQRRRTVQTNLRLCFPAWSAAKRNQQSREVFVYFAQSFLDRSWLWHSPEALLHQRLRLVGSIDALSGNAPTVLFAPHFVGMDVGWLAMNLLTPDNRAYAGIYAPQTSAAMGEWIGQGRARHNAQRAAPTQVSNKDGVRGVLKAIKAGTPLYVLPDMNYEPRDSLFIPFFGVPAATLPVLTRYAKLGGTKDHPAKVVPIVTRMTRSGYDIEVHPAWENYPSGDSDIALEADTLRMNQALERYIETMPAQYYWVHRRFKDQPNGQASPY
jgi:KDO2-lipid IV(A) lauroyltransferase